MFGVIKRNPTLSLTDLCRGLTSRITDREIQESGICSYTGYARFALYNILKLLNLERGSGILLPAYICDVVLLPFPELGLEPVYYGTTDRFKVDFNTVRISSRIKAILTVNYFGMSQDFEAIESFAMQHKLVWINDNSHGFASKHGKKKLESYGDFSITSFRKVLPTINGARACINNEDLTSLRPELCRLNCSVSSENKLVRFLATSLLGNLSYRPWKHPDYSDVMAFSEADIMAFQLDRLSGNILHFTNEDHVQDRRFRLYQVVESFLSQKAYGYIEQIPDLLQDGNSPMVYPVVVKDPAYWKAILRVSREMGIDIHTWPSMPREVIASDLFGSVSCWQQILFLPIHQNLNAEKYCSRLAEIFDSVQ